MKENSQKVCYEVFLNYNCNAKCRFCSQGNFDKSLNAPLRDILRRILLGYKQGYQKLGISGGEPLIHSDILKVIAFSKAAGFKFIRVQTNGLRLADKNFCRQIVDAGLTYCKFTGESHKPEVHDYLVGVKGAWDKMMAGIKNIKKFQIRMGMNILLNAKNNSELPHMLEFFVKQGISDFVIIFPVISGGMVDNFKELGLSLGRASPKIIKSMNIMDKYGVNVLCLNVPPCFMQDYSERAIGAEFNTVVTDAEGKSWDLDTYSREGKMWGEVCKECILKGQCKGANSEYINRFGWEGFKPVLSLSKKSVKTKSLKSKKYFTDNEKCFIKILNIKNNISTSEVLKLAEGIPLCKDCTDGNAVITAGEKLVKSKIIKRSERKGVYYWKLAKNIDV